MGSSSRSLVCVVLLLGLVALSAVRAQDFSVGTGIYDITGPAGQINMMGYANPSQTTLGIQQRLFSRAFVFVDRVTGDRVVYVNLDLAFVTQIVKDYVLKRLQEGFGSLYTARNVGLTGTHTHGGPGGYAEYVLFEVTSLGFVDDNFEAIVEGIYQSIVLAHQNVKPAFLFANEGELLDSNINRSPVAYDNNPAEEKAKYKYNVDKDMTLIKIVDAQGADLGSINWFPVHCTSMNNTNRLITPDNKGYAEYLMEKDFAATTNGNFIAAFSSSNLGDVSPNTGGPFCMSGPNKDMPCDYATSTCPNDNGIPRTQLCHNRGPAGSNDRENNRIIGENQYKKATELYTSARQPIGGRLYVRQQYIDIPNYYVNVNGTSVKLCRAAMGFSFAAGTCDGPGFLNFFQGDTNPDHPFWDSIVDFIKEPTAELRACHAPKPILLPTGEAFRPHDWHPSIVDFQMFILGDLVMMIVPGELSTMAGRRLRDAVRKTLYDGGIISADAKVVVSGLSSTYTHYIVTFEEYQIQRYEGASTIFGPNTLAAYIEIYTNMAKSIINNTTLPQGPTPPDFYDILIRRSPQPKEDLLQNGNPFGAIKRDVEASYTAGSKVSVLFYGANPRNNFMTGGTFLEVQYRNGGSWQVVRTDNDYDTEFRWIPLHDSSAEQFISDIEIVWFTDATTTPKGQYRIQYYGHSRDAAGVIEPFTGLSSTFTIV